LIFLQQPIIILPKCWRICFRQTIKERQLDLLEQHFSEEARELARRIDQGHIDSRGGGDIGATVISVDFVTLNHKRKMPRTLYTVFGQVKINRVSYSRRGHYSLFPLDAKAQFAGSFSYGLQQMVTVDAFANPKTFTMNFIETKPRKNVPIH